MHERVWWDRFPVHGLVFHADLYVLSGPQCAHRAKAVDSLSLRVRGHFSILDHFPIPIMAECQSELLVVVEASRPVLFDLVAER